MVQIPMLGELLLLAIVAVAVALLLSRLRLPVVTGLLAAGALVGPHGLGLVADSANLEQFAEVGVVLLLFTIGLEFSRQRLAHIGKAAAAAGVIQVGATTGVMLLVALVIGESLPRALFFGMAVALSSTAIVLRSLQERAEVDAPHGRLVLGTLIVQDLAIVPMILVVPLLAGQEAAGGLVQLLWILGKAVVMIALALAASRWVIPQLLRLVDVTRSREVFLLAVLSLALGIAWLSMLAGLSLALGAFLAGIMLADSEFSQRALSEVLPVRDVLMSFFFIAMGMLFDWRVLATSGGNVALLLLALLIGKSLIAAVSVLALRFPARVAVLTGLGLAQFGEFGYLLLKAGVRDGIITPDEKALLLCAGLLSMFITPLVIRLAPHITAGEHLLRPLERLLGVRGIDEPEKRHGHLAQHVVIAGYGPSGRMLGETMRKREMPYLVLELNSGTVRELRARGEPAYYADVTSREALHHAQLETARALVLLINDQQAVRRAVANARQLHADLPILVRARFTTQRKQLLALGATAVVVEETEAGKEIIAQVCSLFCETGTVDGGEQPG